MAWFGQGRDTIEWNEFRDDVLFYRWPNTEIKKGARLVIRPGQRAIFFAGGQLEGVFEQPGTYDVETDITPFLSSLKGWFQLRGDTGLRAEVYFVNAKELLLKWGTRQRIMIPTQEVPSGIPVGCNGNLIVEFRDYVQFINKIAGVKSTYSLRHFRTDYGRAQRYCSGSCFRGPAERRAQRPCVPTGQQPPAGEADVR